MEGIIRAISNTYERKARLYPAVLALVPVIGVAVGFYGVRLEFPEAFGGVVVAFGGFYLLANIVRELGKRLESTLYSRWGGKPTTQLLRHRNGVIDRVTKASCHSFLAEKLQVASPTPADEEADSAAADDFYSAATRWLLEQTRDSKRFDLLFRENVEYGYRRNALGLKPIALLISLGAIAWVLALGSGDGFSSGEIGSLVVSVALLLVWCLFFTERSVRSAAFAYAEALVRACIALKQS